MPKPNGGRHLQSAPAYPSEPVFLHPPNWTRLPWPDSGQRQSRKRPSRLWSQRSVPG